MGAQHPGGLLHRFQAAAHRAEARKSAQLFATATAELFQCRIGITTGPAGMELMLAGEDTPLIEIVTA